MSVYSSLGYIKLFFILIHSFNDTEELKTSILQHQLDLMKLESYLTLYHVTSLKGTAPTVITTHVVNSDPFLYLNDNKILIFHDAYIDLATCNMQANMQTMLHAWASRIEPHACSATAVPTPLSLTIFPCFIHNFADQLEVIYRFFSYFPKHSRPCQEFKVFILHSNWVDTHKSPKQDHCHQKITVDKR